MISTPREGGTPPNPKKCEKLAELLISVGEGNWAGNDNIFKEVFIKSSGEELILIGRYYYKKTGKNMLDIIEKKITGKNKILLFQDLTKSKHNFWKLPEVSLIISSFISFLYLSL